MVAPGRPRAYILTIGINRMPSALNYDLGFAVNDAREVGSSLKSALSAILGTGGAASYENVALEVLTSDDASSTASKQQIHGAISRIAGLARPQDEVFLAFAGHGATDPSGQFYLFPADARIGAKGLDPETWKSAISTTELTDWLRAVDAKEIVLIIDACQSAASVEQQGFKPGPLGDAGLGQLAYDKKIRILAASGSSEVALEARGLSHGLLSYALLEGLRSTEADWQPKDGYTDVREWLTYAARRVPELAEDLVARKLRGILPRQGQRIAQQPYIFDFSADRGPIIEDRRKRF